MSLLQTPLITEWPKISFSEIENLEVEEGLVRIFYKSFFVVLRVPEIMFSAFLTILRENPDPV